MTFISRRAVFSLLTPAVCLLAFLVSACGSTSNRSADAVLAAREDWVRALHTKQLDAIINMYAPDAMFIRPDGGRSTGRDAIRAVTQQAMNSFTSDIHFQTAAMVVSGNFAYDSGDFNETLVLTDGSGTLPGAGAYLTVYSRQADGKWLIAQQVWTQKTNDSPDVRPGTH
jgi:uncharacterized protein (TIGR02246 family)